MRFFRNRQTPVENLTFIAMMVAFDAILSLVSALVPFSALFLMLVAPLTSAAISLFCQKRYTPLYLFAALGIGIAVTAWDFLNTLFYLFPALLTGYLYGFLWRAKFPSSVNLFLTSLLSLALFYASIALIKAFLGGVDMIEVLLTLIQRSQDETARTIVPLFLYGYSLTQTAISHAFLTSELKRLGQEEPEDKQFALWYGIAAIVFLVSSVITGFFHAKIAYFLLGIGIYWTLFSVTNLVPKVHPITIGLLVGSLFLSTLLFALLYRYMPLHCGLLLLSVPFGLFALCNTVNPVFLSHIKTKQRHYE